MIIPVFHFVIELYTRVETNILTQFPVNLLFYFSPPFFRQFIKRNWKVLVLIDFTVEFSKDMLLLVKLIKILNPYLVKNFLLIFILLI